MSLPQELQRPVEEKIERSDALELSGKNELRAEADRERKHGADEQDSLFETLIYNRLIEL
jgi:hypothetical protein